MRPRKPRHEDSTASAGSKLRDALAKQQSGEQQREQDEAARQQDAFRQSLSGWFNNVAAQVVPAVKDITEALEGGRRVSTDLSFSAGDSISVRGVTGVDLETLDGFKALAKTCQDLDVECTVTSGRHGYGRKSTAGQEYLHVSIDAAQPYQPLTAEKAQPHPHRGPRFR